LLGWSGWLEDRTLLSTITVNTTNDQQDVSDSATSVGSTVSLRDAVIVASNLDGSTEIDVPAGTYNLGNVGTGELQVGGMSGQSITIRGLGTPANTIINQTITGNRIFNFDNGQYGSIAGSISNVTIQGATNVDQPFGGGAIIAGGPSDSLTLTNCVVQNNSTSNGSSSISNNGGGIGYSGGGNLTISSCIFSNDKAGGNANTGSAGGAVDYDNDTNPGNLTISNTVFNGDSATGPSNVSLTGASAGALFVSGTGTDTITASTFTNNSAGASNSQGGAIQAGGGTVSIADCRFFNDTASSGSGIDNTGATITANDNWWGADGFPGSTGTDTVVTTAGTTTDSTRLSLKLAPTASTIGINSSTTLTAKIVSTSVPTVAVTGTALEGVNLSFAPGALGSVNPTTVAIANGTASTTFSSGTPFGTTTPNVSLDNSMIQTSITIVGAPTANSQSVNVAHNTPKGITLTASDPNTPPLTLTYMVGTPAHGMLTGTAPNLIYTPNANYQGTDSFTFTVSNGVVTSNTATVTLNVAAGVPTANSQTVNVGFNTAKSITLTGTDPDVPALTLTYLVTGNPSHGMLTGTAPNLTYTPNAGYHGSDTFTFTVNNGTNTSTTATVTLNVATGVPTANPQTVNLSENSSTSVSLTGSDPDVPALTLTYAIVGSLTTSNGTISNFNPATGTLTYTPNANYFGTDSFQFTVSNGTNTSSPATVTLNVSQNIATVSGNVGITWGTAGTTTLQTNADGLRLLPAGRGTDLPWLGINKLSITLSQAATLLMSDVTVTGINVANYGPVTISGSGTSYTITLAQPINAADRVTVTIGNANIATYTRRLDVLPGDFNADGGVTVQDAGLIRNEYLGIGGASPTIFGDVNGDGTVDVNDYNAARRLIGTTLP
jgi:Bacterial Ig domain/Dockerin type I domain